MSKVFAAAAVWGRLVLRDIRDADSWNPERVAYWDETYLDGVSRLALAGGKVRSATELDAAVAASRRQPGICDPYPGRDDVVRGMKASGIPRAAVTRMGL